MTGIRTSIKTTSGIKAAHELTAFCPSDASPTTSKEAIKPRWLVYPCAVLAPIALLNGIVGLATANGGNFPLAPLAIVILILVTVIHGVAMIRSAPSPQSIPSPAPQIAGA